MAWGCQLDGREGEARAALMERWGQDWVECGSRELDREQVSEDQVHGVAEGAVGEVTAGEGVGAMRSQGWGWVS